MSPFGTGMVVEMVRQRMNVLATVLLLIGLIVAVATDGTLPEPAAKGLFIALLGLDGVMIRWLIKVNNS